MRQVRIGKGFSPNTYNRRQCKKKCLLLDTLGDRNKPRVQVLGQALRDGPSI